MTDVAQDNKTRKGLKLTLILASALILIDAFAYNDRILAMFIGAWMLLIALPRALIFTKDSELKRHSLKRTAVVIVAVAVVFVCTSVNDRIAASRAETVIVAVNSFKERNQRYPKTLEELTPEFLERVPKTSPTLLFNSFHYISNPTSPSLFYVTMPPFGRRFYSFERGEWSYMD